MIYPDITLKDWLELYPVLEVAKQKCRHCGTIQTTTIPFIEKDWVGLQSNDCQCGKSKAISVSAVRETSVAYGLVDSWLISFKETK